MPRRSSRRTARWLGSLWALPCTLVGLGWGLLALCSGASWTWHRGTLEVAGGWLPALVQRLPGLRQFGAVTLGQVILAIDERTLVELRAHERVHVRQYLRWGPLFWPAYLGSSLWALCRGRHPYLANRFEREAYALDALRHADTLIPGNDLTAQP